jgi:hypothetical protein
MSTSFYTETEPTVTKLVGGIVHDAQDLMSQQMALFRAEVQEDIRKTKEAAIALACGFFLAQIGLSVLCFMFVYLLQALQPALPLWGCFGIVGGILAVVGGVCLAGGIYYLKSFNPLPDESAKALKENFKWIANAR